MTDLETALEACARKLESGQSTLDECLVLYPEHATKLRPLLTAVVRLQATRAVRASPALRSSAHAALSAYVRSHPHGTSVPAPRGGWRATPFRPLSGRRFALAFATVLFVVLLSGTALAQAALPGDALYGWKLAGEQAWKALSPDPLGVDLAIAERRAAEWVQVRGNVPLALRTSQEYLQSLEALAKYRAPATRDIIRAALLRQQGRLRDAGIQVPALDQIVKELQVVPPLQRASPTPSTPMVIPTIRPTLPALIDLATPAPTLQPLVPTEFPIPSPTVLALPKVIPTLAPTVLPVFPTQLPQVPNLPVQLPSVPAPVPLPSIP